LKRKLKGMPPVPSEAEFNNLSLRDLAIKLE
jgi:hypothetical protein